MKKLSAIILFLVSFNSIGQDFGAIGSEWYYGFLSSMANDPSEATYVRLNSVADTVVQGKSVRRIDGTGFWLPDGSFGPFFVYQQSDTAYFYSHYREKFVSLYIFNRNPGDTIELDYPFIDQGETDSTYKQVIDSVTTVIINGVPLKKYYTTPLGYRYWIEGNAFIDRIGSVNWYIPVGPTVATGYHGPLRCYNDGQIDINFWNMPCDMQGINAAPEPVKQKVLVHPNPFTNNLTLKLSDALSGIAQITISDLQGRKIHTSEHKIAGNRQDLNIQLPNMPAGLYFLRVSNQNQIYITKIVRQ